jgi:hypothetical protein
MNRSLIVFMNISNIVKYPAGLVGFISRLFSHMSQFALFFLFDKFFLEMLTRGELIQSCQSSAGSYADNFLCRRASRIPTV